MSVITLDGIKNQKHRNFIKYVSDIFDENRGNIPDHLAFTRFNGTNHTILFNTANPELNGKSLVQFDNDKVLFAPAEIQSLLCNDPANNPTINTLILPDNKNTWEAKSDDKIIKIMINFKDKTPIAGFSAKFADATKTKYRMSLTLFNDERNVLSQVPTNMDSSWDTNNTQFFQLATPVEGATKAVMDIELVGTNKDFVWKIDNISFYSNMNLESLKALSDSGIITWSFIQNSVFVKELDDKSKELFTLDQQQQQSQEQTLLTAAVSGGDIDHYGSPIPYKPIIDREYFDNLSADELIKISNVTRLYTITDLPTGDKIYTFETDPNTKNLTLKFSPMKEMAKYPDDPVVQLDIITKSGQIKKGGFKNYVLTFYVRLDGLTMTDQKLLWKYGGYYFNESRPECSRAVDVTIPINNQSGDTPHVYTEYFYNSLVDMGSRMTVKNHGSFKGLEEGKWIGIQCIRQVDTENQRAIQIVRINKDPFNEENNSINTNGFEEYLLYDDMKIDNHTPAVWSGTQEIVSVSGSKYVSLYGISLYECEYSNTD
jgi:hypothetical protein